MMDKTEVIIFQIRDQFDTQTLDTSVIPVKINNDVIFQL